MKTDDNITVEKLVKVFGIDFRIIPRMILIAFSSKFYTQIFHLNSL